MEELPKLTICYTIKEVSTNFKGLKLCQVPAMTTVKLEVRKRKKTAQSLNVGILSNDILISNKSKKSQ